MWRWYSLSPWRYSNFWAKESVHLYQLSRFRKKSLNSEDIVGYKTQVIFSFYYTMRKWLKAPRGDFIIHHNLEDSFFVSQSHGTTKYRVGISEALLFLLCCFIAKGSPGSAKVTHTRCPDIFTLSLHFAFFITDSFQTTESPYIRQMSSKTHGKKRLFLKGLSTTQ